MAIDYQKLTNWKFDDFVHDFTQRDTMLYALGVGLGVPPTDAAQLPFVYEEGLRALPSMAAVLAYRGFWVKDPSTGINWQKVVHADQSIDLLKPLPVEGRVIGKQRVAGLIDRGPGKGSLLYNARDVIDDATGDMLCKVRWSNMLRGDDSFGGPSGPIPAAHVMPESPADHVVDLPTLPQAALIYRLSGDYNPLHADPAVAKAAGFPAPILHGLCTFGVAGHALLKVASGYRPERVKSLHCRFSSPVYPGDTIRTEIWNASNGKVSFRSTAVERNVVVLNNGWAEVDS